MEKIMNKYYIIGILVAIIIVIYILYKIFSFSSNKNYNKSDPLNDGLLLNDTIGLRYLPHFLTPYDCNHLITVAEGKFFKSGTIKGKDDTFQNEDRTSYSYYFEKSHDEVIRTIEERVSFLTGKSIDAIERLQIVRYQPGQQYKQHYDWFEDEYRDKIGGQRQYTFFVYLNDVYDGGETEFPNLGIKVKPKMGDAVFWVNCEKYNKCYDLSLHQGNPPSSGVKYGLNIWIRF